MRQEVAHRAFECGDVSSRPSRHDHMHHVAALAAVELAAPFLLHQVARDLLIRYRLAAIVANIVMPIDQPAQAASAELDAISVAMKGELRRSIAGGRAGVVSALDNAGRLRIARQPLALPASQYDKPLNGHGAAVIFRDRIGIAPVAKAARQGAPHLLVQCRVRCKAVRRDFDGKTPNVAAFCAVLKKVVPIATDARQFLPTLEDPAAFIFHLQLAAAGHIIQHRTDPSTAAIRSHFDDCRLASLRDGR
nr:hypothetical protein [Sinorhizobium meliloti]